MTRIRLVNMPFADWNRPSFALSQLSAQLAKEFGTTVDVEVCYPNFDFARYLTGPLYDEIAGNLTHLMAGLGDWLFRSIAFPDAEDNALKYFERYYIGSGWKEFKTDILHFRSGLQEVCEEIIDLYQLDSADIVGFTSMFMQNTPSIAMMRLLKKRNPNVVTVIGGANCETPMGTVLAREVEAIDVVFSGPALCTFPEFLHHFNDGSLESIHEIPGIVTARNCDNECFASAIGRERDIDDFVEPDYGQFIQTFSKNRDHLGADVEPILLFETSRGCWWGQRSHCTFCGLNGLGMDYRAMKPELAIRQFEWLFQFAPWCQKFACTDNILPRNYADEVFSKLNVPDGVILFYEVKLPLSAHEMQVLASAGVTSVQPGIESLDTDTLKLMGKGTSSFLNLQFLKNCIVHGINPEWNLLIGFPGEPPVVYERYLENLPLLRHLPPPTGAHMVRFDRYSLYLADPEKYGLALWPMDFYGLIYPFDEEQLTRLAYFFTDRNIAPYMSNSIKALKSIRDLVERWRICWEADCPPEVIGRANADGGLTITDTRGIGREKIELSREMHQMLRRLTSARSVVWLASDMGIPADRIRDLLAHLSERGLLFEEKERFLSLVQL